MLAGARFTAGYTGHLYPGRGGELLVELSAALPQITFLIVGGEAQDLSCFSHGGEGSTGLSTPKRYLWDTTRRYHEWRFNTGATGLAGSMACSSARRIRKRSLKSSRDSDSRVAPASRSARRISTICRA